MSVLSSAQVTLAWSAGILATVRYYQLAAPTAATPTAPTSSSSLGSWTETASASRPGAHTRARRGLPPNADWRHDGTNVSVPEPAHGNALG